MVIFLYGEVQFGGAALKIKSHVVVQHYNWCCNTTTKRAKGARITINDENEQVILLLTVVRRNLLKKVIIKSAFKKSQPRSSDACSQSHG